MILHGTYHNLRFLSGQSGYKPKSYQGGYLQNEVSMNKWTTRHKPQCVDYYS